jgi:hypothetical protein
MYRLGLIQNVEYLFVWRAKYLVRLFEGFKAFLPQIVQKAAEGNFEFSQEMPR